MYEFETFVYLDVEKTGSTFIRDFLEQFCTEREVSSEKHAGVRSDYDKSKLYFISVRSPLDQYLSLYSFGCEMKGKLTNRLQKAGYGHFYDGTWEGFRKWLKFVLDPANSRYLAKDYGRELGEAPRRLIGYQSFRVLALAIPEAVEVLNGCGDRDAVRTAYREKNIATHTVRQETLRSDLAQLATTSLRHCISDLPAALRFIESEAAVNTSDRIDRYGFGEGVRDKQVQLLREREWFLYEHFGYDV